MTPTRPRARRERLIVRRLGDELLVYDLDRFAAVCLNRTAAAVWERCDGNGDVEAIARGVAAEIDARFDAQAVWCALDGLEKRGLVEPVAAAESRPRRTRREWLHDLGRAGVSAALIPAVLSVVAPSAAEAASVIDAMACMNLSPDNCGGARCINPSGGTCQKVQKGASGIFQCECV